MKVTIALIFVIFAIILLVIVNRDSNLVNESSTKVNTKKQTKVVVKGDKSTILPEEVEILTEEGGEDSATVVTTEKPVQIQVQTVDEKLTDNRVNGKELSLDEIPEIKYSESSLSPLRFDMMPVEDLSLFLKHPVKKSLRLEAIRALGERKELGREYLSDVIALINTSDDLINSYIAEALPKLDQTSEVSKKALMDLYHLSGDENIRKSVIKGLSLLKNMKKEEFEILLNNEKSSAVKAKIQIAINKLDILTKDQ